MNIAAAFLVALAALPGPAHAFCGTFVGAAGAALTNRSSQVVIGRDGIRTTLSLAMDYEGDAQDFALLLPVPAVLGPDDVSLADAELMTWIQEYSTPRGVRYTCDDVFDVTHSSGGAGCGMLLGCSDSQLASPTDMGGQGLPADDSVTVEASFTESDYDIVVLSAEESGDLFRWLRDNGYEVPRGGNAILQEYIDAGAYFLAARISLDAAPAGVKWLPPLRISYDSEVFGLPIRIGTISAEDEQEVVIYTVTPASGGDVGIANYPELGMEDECMWQPEGDGDSLSEWYGRKVAEAVADNGAGWIEEYSWDLVPTSGTGYHCDPCTAEPAIPGGTFAPFGLDSDGAHLTRLRMRYSPEEATQDLVLYDSGIVGVAEQIRYIQYDRKLEFLYPVCEEGWVAEPGECPEDGIVGCNVPAMRVGGLGVLAALALLRRRRA